MRHVRVCEKTKGAHGVQSRQNGITAPFVPTPGGMRKSWAAAVLRRAPAFYQWFALAFFVFAFLLPLPAAATLRVVASVPDLGDMAREIGGENIKLTVLATGQEDLHAVPARPSFLPKLNRADLLLTLGLDAEHAWLPALAAEARNPRIQYGREGWIDVSKDVEVLDKPVRLDRSEGEQHPLGNPHYNIGPQNGAVMARNVAEALIQAEPKHEALFRQNLENYLSKVETLVKALREKGGALKGVTIVEYHPDMAYLCRFYGLEILGSIEAKPGVPPTAGHLSQLTESAKKAEVKLIIHNQSQHPALAEKLAKAANAARVELANSVGAKEGINTWMDLQKYNLEVLLRGLEEAP